MSEAEQAATASNGAGSWPPSGAPGGLVAERPELAVGAAFIGGLIAARIIKRLGR